MANVGGRTNATCATSGCEVNRRIDQSTMGTPPTEWNCLGVVLPNRTPLPAATMMAPTSRGKCLHQLIDVIQSYE